MHPDEDPDRRPEVDADPPAQPGSPAPRRSRSTPEDRDHVTRRLERAMSLLVVSIFVLAVPLAGVGLPALTLVPLGLVLVLLVVRQVRVRAVRARPETAVPPPVRVVRSRPPAPEEPELIPGARPVPPGRVRPTPTWPAARDRFARLRGEYADFECDPMQVLHLPALTDATVPSTARFIDAFADAQALATDHYPGPEHARRFITAAAHAERTWRAARDAAERIRLSGLTPAERTTVERVLKLLTTARDTDSEPERLAAYSRARTELTKLDRAGVVHLPRPARAALDEAARKQLPPG